MTDILKSYYAIIPANIRYDNDLNPNAKLLYGEITALCNEKGYCWATNEYFSKLYNVSERTITEWIKLLQNKKYISTNIETKRYDDGTVKKIRYIHIEVFGNNHIENLLQNHIEENFQYNNTYNNITKENNISLDILKESTPKILKRYFDNDEIDDLFQEYLEQRKKMKVINTQRAITLLLNKLNNHNDYEKKQMLEEAIEHSWKSVYELNRGNNNRVREEVIYETI